MSYNHWETQPRKNNGEFTFRYLTESKHFVFLQTVSEIFENIAKKIFKGGKYGDLRKITTGNSFLEIHHMPADSVTNLSTWNGTCIIMTKADHKKTASYGNYKASKEYRKKQKDLVDKGMFLEAEFMDIENIRNIFGSKYNLAISEKLDYENKLEMEGKLNVQN